MTTDTFVNRDQRAHAKIEEIVRRSLRAPAPKEIKVSAQNNHSGDPALYVYILMSDGRQIPQDSEQLRLSGELLSALQEIDDDRFPYVSYGPRGSDNADLTTPDSV